MSINSMRKANRQRGRALIFNSVSELGDLEFQRVTWTDPEMQNPHYSYVEFVECFYDRCGGGYDSADMEARDAPFQLKLAEGVISPNERDLLWKVHLALKDYKEPNGHYDHMAILNDPAWHAVVSVASSCAAALRANVEPTDDVQAFVNSNPSQRDKRWP